ncbi:NUDIX domain-containing protein [Krasilnikovia cinnamomea]|uniref:NUDIX domain-containing protein n=1 Tax=Krasilnikovia cinnamomea TaxID=349313 RepID=A0A4Q7ZU93_9ACTN|nr:NUDIX hydrolase [Krasilnikovia cinnamomea]RZU54471.1 NUDIX domain-containing protein [Krasilnikovia cinnamomea]
MPESLPARPTVSAGAVFFDDQGRVLLVDPTYKQFWNLPGGGVDTGETPRAACLREVREELGLIVGVGALLVAAWTPAGPDGKLYFVFDGGVLDARQRDAIVLNPGELARHAFVDPDEADQMLSAPQRALMTEVVAARAAGHTRYVELAEAMHAR